MLRFLVLLAFATAVAADDTAKDGYVDCSPPGDKHRATPIFSNPCTLQPVGNLSCGETVKVLSREGPWLKITSGDGERYISVTSVSKKKGQFVPLDLPVSSEAYLPDCSAFRPKTGTVPPLLIFGSGTEFFAEGLKKNVKGTLTLSLTIGRDGRAHDIKVFRAVGHGMDEKAIETVQSWKWEPALEEGTPVETKITLDLSFH